MDERYIETAEAFEASQREEAIKAIRARRQEFPPTGMCYNCESPVEGLQLYCDAGCAEEHEWFLSRSRTNAAKF